MRSDISPKPSTTSQDLFNMSEVKKLLQRMSNEMVDLKKKNNENQSNYRGFNTPPFKRPTQPLQNTPPPNPSKGFTSEEIFSILKALAIGTPDILEPYEDQSTQDSQPPQEEEEADQQVSSMSFFSEEEEEEEPDIVFNLQHTHNTRYKGPPPLESSPPT